MMTRLVRTLSLQKNRGNWIPWQTVNIKIKILNYKIRLSIPKEKEKLKVSHE